MKFSILILCSLICQTIALTLSAPRNLAVTESSTLSHSLELRWDPPLSHDNDIVGYTIYYIIDTPGSHGSWEIETTKGNETFATVPQPHQVTSESRYVFRLQARGKNGAGPPSDDFIFDTKEISGDHTTSEVTTSDDECNLPKDSGPCLAYLRNYYYNSRHQQCEEFIYGGCRGNKNNFKTKEECEERCIKGHAEVQPDQTDNALLSVPRNLVVTASRTLSRVLDLHWDPPLNHGEGITGYVIYYSVDTPGTPNEWNEITTEGSESFTTIQAPHSANDRSKFVFRLQARGRHSNGPISEDFVYDFDKVFSDDRSGLENSLNFCNLPSDTGRCLAYIQRYYYNPDSKKCEEFIYGGCEGNDNNFQTKAECEYTCGREEEYSPVLPPINNVPLSAPKNLVVTESDTVSHTLDLYWDPPLNPDEDIIGYTIYYLIDTPGSRGEWKVQKTEGRGTFATISQPHVVTPESRYVFHLEARGRNGVGPASEDFIFDHKDIMTDSTKSGISTSTNLCNLPSNSGPCKANLRHYYYNSDKSECEEFIYGGCQGNENNFQTKEECEESCGKEQTENVPTQATKVPLSAPRNLVVKESSEVSHVLNLHWDPPLNNGEGIIGYTIYYLIDTPVSRGEWKVVKTEGTRTFTTIPQPHVVTPKSRYVFRLQAEDKNGIGTISEDFIFEHNEIVTDSTKSGISTSTNLCNLPSDSGPCKANLRHYYYNSDKSECEEFIYGGCQGNENNFRTNEECEESCGKEQTENVPTQATKVPLSAPRNLVVKESSEVSHVLNLHWDPPLNNGEGVIGYTIYYIIDTPGSRGKWKVVKTEGSGTFTTVPQPHVVTSKSRYVFRLEAEDKNGIGPISEDFVFDHYEVSTTSEPVTDDNLCNLPSDAGQCSDYLKRYYYNPNYNGCRQFIYSGCGGNNNNFETKVECEDACGEKQFQPHRTSNVYVPLSAPKDLFVVKSREESPTLELHWNAPPQATEEILGYVIYYAFGTPETPDSWRVKQVSGNNTFVKIADPHLENYKKGLIIRLQARGKERFGRVSDDFMFEVEDLLTGREASSYSEANTFCHLPSDSGPCRAGFRHYYYNSDNKRCEEFIYGGCDGNDNNFKTKAECEETCGRETHARIIPVSRVFTGREADTPSEANNFCHLPSDTGPCRAYSRNYYYNSENERCEVFVYGGCEGNKNNFKTKEECEETCGKITHTSMRNVLTGRDAGSHSEASNVCHLPSDAGLCKAHFTNYYYNSENKRCEEFIYGGCDGNENNFKTKDECEETCGRETHSPVNSASNVSTGRDAGSHSEASNVCHLPSDTGPCKAHLTNYYYSSENKRCEEFIFGGCGGNENNFKTKAECEKTCERETYVFVNPTSNVLTGREADSHLEANNFCHLPSDTGPCKAHFTNYYYNSENKRCEEFIYGGCRGNENNFKTKAECEETCGRETHAPVNPASSVLTGREVDSNSEANNFCHLPSDTGPCKAHFTNYYYNSENKRCEEFIYGGCRGNENNFKTKAECEETCGRETHAPVKPASSVFTGREADTPSEANNFCHLPSDTGPCRAYSRNYYYNSENERCEVFVYGGCEGNKNNFKTKEECEETCGKITHTSMRNVLTGREVDSNSEANNFCHLPSDTGPCKAHFTNYYYNSENKRCEEFIYRGCGGNENNFKTKVECEETCGRETHAPVNPAILTGREDDSHSEANNFCHLPSDTGPCKAHFTNYYYNSENKRCEEFIYGGCGGNENNFKTKAECEETCGRETHAPVNPASLTGREADSHSEANNFCHLPSDTGPCKAHFTNHYYNSENKRCEEFIYGGCGGNENNFKTKVECEETCGRETHAPVNPAILTGREVDSNSEANNFCHLPSDTGPCKAHFTNYYYNSENKRCEEFIYGGCRGNENNFKTKAECEETCGRETHAPVNPASSEICKEPKEPGICYGYSIRYYYDIFRQRCESFVYGGCLGNRNNFKTRDECEKTCMKSADHSES
ncbi:uncharacterized protein LOC143246253 isoform X2 [Tachypleus tridentatus]|uniref:uncharacterized protein LOC143246253 isoform X2 n=1 Tax=Tachypleus tridentatus TaxID=6853 RepID=UPI003FD47923